METFLLVLFVIIAFTLVIVVLLQQGKGADMGVSFGGGGSQTVFGAAGSGNFMTKLTGWLATAFMVIALMLAGIAKDHQKGTSVIQPNAGVATSPVAAPAAPAQAQPAAAGNAMPTSPPAQ